MESDTSFRKNSTEKGPSWALNCLSRVKEYFEVYDYKTAGNAMEIFVSSPVEPISWERALHLTYKDLVERGCYPRLVKRENTITIVVVRHEDKGSRKILGIILAITTLILVYISGLSLNNSKLGNGFAWSPAGYLIGLLLPLLIHEMGHWITLRRYKTPASIPYLLPAPPLQLGFLGTFGAVINMRWLPPDNFSLALVGIAGPISGFIAALPFAYYGLKASVVLPLGTSAAQLPVVPLIFTLIPVPFSVGPHEAVYISPMAFASYVVFIVTFLNLLPVASLDGGHVIRALHGFKIHYIVSLLLVLSLIAASYKWPFFIIFALLALGVFYLNRSGHPGSALGINSRDKGLFIIGIIYAMLFILTMPVPVR